MFPETTEGKEDSFLAYGFRGFCPWLCVPGAGLGGVIMLKELPTARIRERNLGKDRTSKNAPLVTFFSKRSHLSFFFFTCQ